MVSDHQNAAGMSSKRRFWDFRPIQENRALNVNFSQSGQPPPCRRGHMQGSRLGGTPPLSEGGQRGVEGGFWPQLARTPHVPPRAGENLGMYSRIEREPWGVYSRIERHGDRQTTGDWQFEVIVALGAPQSPQIANRPCSVCRGRVGGGAPRCRERATGCWELAPKFWQNCFRLSRALAQDFGCLASKFWVFGFEILGVWHRKLGVWLRCWGNPHLV